MPTAVQLIVAPPETLQLSLISAYPYAASSMHSYSAHMPASSANPQFANQWFAQSDKSRNISIVFSSLSTLRGFMNTRGALNPRRYRFSGSQAQRPTTIHARQDGCPGTCSCRCSFAQCHGYPFWMLTGCTYPQTFANAMLPTCTGSMQRKVILQIDLRMFA